jgi:hypothetical protein
MLIQHQRLNLADMLEDLLDVVFNPAFECSLQASKFETNTLLASEVANHMSISKEDINCYLDHLLDSQLEDGSWREDPDIFYLPDAVISTTSAILALLVNGKVEKHAPAVQNGLHFIAQHITELLQFRDEKKTIGFEAILIEHLTRLSLLGISLPIDNNALHFLNQKKWAKIATKLDYLYNTNVTLHSVMDAFNTQSDIIDWDKIARFQEPNGSMGIYGSSTVALLEHSEPDSSVFYKGIAYLEAAMLNRSGLPPFFPSDAFEVWWALYHLADSPLSQQVDERIQNATHLLSKVPPKGIAVTADFSLPDVDTTAMKLASRLFLDHDVDVQSLSAFRAGDVYQCYQFEKRISPSANLHALMALVLKSEQNPAAASQLVPSLTNGLRFLLEDIGDNGYLVDKWHLSNLYTTCHAIELFIELENTPIIVQIHDKMRDEMNCKLLEMLQYILSQRNMDGGWGEMGYSTVEETGYVVRALSKAHIANIIDITPLIEPAHTYLANHSWQEDIPLWIGKTLYKSKIITQAVQLSALAWLDYIIERIVPHALNETNKWQLFSPRIRNTWHRRN